MAILPPLITTSELKTARIQALVSNHMAQYGVFYDDRFDTLIVRYVPVVEQAVVHFVDDKFAFLVEPESLEVIGFQIEDFKSQFMARSAAVTRAWTLPDAADIRDVGDLVLMAQRRAAELAHEVARVAKGTVEAEAVPLLDAMI